MCKHMVYIKNINVFFIFFNIDNLKFKIVSPLSPPQKKKQKRNKWRSVIL